MKTKKGFTLVELLVVIAIIALLMSILMPALARAKIQSQRTACLVQLKQWCLIFMMYAEDNGGSMISDEMYLKQNYPGQDPGEPGAECWPQLLMPIYKDRDLLLCPRATKPWAGNAAWFGKSDYAWDIPAGNLEFDAGGIGSYGTNDVCYNGPKGTDATWGYGKKKWWRTFNVRGASKIPVLSDCVHIGHFMWDGGNKWGSIEGPPTIEEEPFSGGDNRICMDRHGNRTICVLFADCSVRAIGLKEIWTLKWNKFWPIANKYTWAGYPKKKIFPTKSVWPKWLWNAKQY